MTDDTTATGPVRVCPHCHAQSQGAGKRCPHCNKKFKKRSKALTILLVLVVLFVLGVGGCAALIGGAANEVDKAIEEETEKGITAAQFDSIEQGTSRTAVEERLGEPDDVQEMEINTSDLAEITGGPEATQHDCIYYKKAGEFASLYQFCFENGELQSKSSY